MSLLCVIPARGGSKGLPGKNLRQVGGVSLVGRAVLAARAFLADAGIRDARVLVDTDDAAIAAEGCEWGADVPFLRAPALATDTASTVDTIFGLLDRLTPAPAADTIVVLLQPTSPLRTAEEIATCWRAVRDGAHSAATVCPTQQPVDLALRVDYHGALEWLQGDADGRRRQETRGSVHLTGAVYVTRVATLRSEERFVVAGKTRAVLMPRARAVDVDDADDLAAADAAAREARPDVIRIGTQRVGDGAPCLVIAEAGVNHNGDIALAHKLVDAAADAGADVVKFQTFDPDALAAAAAPTATYQSAATGDTSQLEMLRRLVLPASAWRELSAHAAERGLRFLSTPFDRASAELLDALGVAAFKVPSGELTNLPFLADLAARGRPLLISTGMATLAEVGDALLTVRAAGAPPVALLHCVSQYPAPLDACNLAAIATLRAAFGVPAGWSDHTPGGLASIAAVAAGASLIEKHLTIDCRLPGPDHAASLEPTEFAQLVRDIRAVERMRGDGVKRPAACELETRGVARRSLHAVRDLAPGERLRPEDVVALRPGTGLPPRVRDAVVGRALRVGVTAGTMLEEAHLG